MRFHQETVREGEYLGPVDWTFNFHDRDSERCMGTDNIQRRVERFKTIEEGDEVTTDGGWPRVGWGRVIQIGMYDGWPAWSPTPCVLKTGTLGSEWKPWYSITDVRKKEVNTEKEG